MNKKTLNCSVNLFDAVDNTNWRSRSVIPNEIAPTGAEIIVPYDQYIKILRTHRKLRNQLVKIGKAKPLE